MKEKIVRIINNRKLVWGLLLVFCLASGIIQTAATYDAALGMGDNSTFYAFARNIAHGEAMYKDFIHFRTPGTVTMFSVFMHIFGQQQSTIEIGTRIETLVLYPLLFVIAGMVLFRKKNPWYVVAAFLGLMLFPGVAQLRAGFGLLTIAIYSVALEARSRQKWWLLGTGFSAFLTFYFGQEIFLMVCLCIAAIEIIYRKDHITPWRRVGYLVGGSLIGFVPLFLYMGITSNIANFLYYTTYYSFVQQPKFMNLPFPNFGFTNLFSYMPFILYWLAFLVVYTNKRLGARDGLLLSFGILRLITAVGRSDFGHLLFSIPEVYLIIPYLVVRSRWSDLTKSSVRAFAPFGAVLAVLLLLATKNGIALVPAPFVVLFALSKRDKHVSTAKPKIATASAHLYFVFGALMVLFVYMLMPTYLAGARAVKQGLANDGNGGYRIGGVKTDEITYDEIQAVRASVRPLKPQTVFAFPIQPFYYSLANKHASRFLTFEPEITVHEQDETIQDLKRTKPQVVIFDPLQAQGLSTSVWKISDYVTSNYQIHKEISMREIVWVMVPKAHPARDEALVNRLYHDNTEVTNKLDTSGIQSTEQGLSNAILQNNQQVHFSVNSSKGAHLSLALLDTHGKVDPNECAQVAISYESGKSEQTKICSSDGTVLVPIGKSTEPVTITFNNQTGKSIIWNDPAIVD